MKKLTAEETLVKLIGALTESLTELTLGEQNEFVYGEKTAYVECLEWIQAWQRAGECGLDYDVEARFPL